MISLEQINAIDEAIVFLTYDNPGCRLYVGIEEIEVETANGDYLAYNVFYRAYKTIVCYKCDGQFVAQEMYDDYFCHDCSIEEDMEYREK